MEKPVVLRKGEGEMLFTAEQVCALEDQKIDFRDCMVNSQSLIPGGALPLGVHDDKLEVVTPIALGAVDGPVVKYTDDEGGYEFELNSYDSIVIGRGIKHAAYNLCDCRVALYITDFRYSD